MSAVAKPTKERQQEMKRRPSQQPQDMQVSAPEGNDDIDTQTTISEQELTRRLEPGQQNNQQVQQPSGGGEAQKKDDGGGNLSLRIDLNLDIEIQLKAKIHGDITLSLL